MADDVHFLPAEGQLFAAIEADDFVRRIKSSGRTLPCAIRESRGPLVMPAAEHFLNQGRHFMFLP